MLTFVEAGTAFEADLGYGEDGPRQIDLRNEGTAPGEMAHRLGRRLREERPDQLRREQIHGVVPDVATEQLRKHERKDGHHQQRVEHRPRDAEHGALVPGPHIAADELNEEVAIPDELVELTQEGWGQARRIVDAGVSAERERIESEHPLEEHPSDRVRRYR